MNPRMGWEGVDFEFWARKYHLREKTCACACGWILQVYRLVVFKSVHDALVNGRDDVVRNVIGL